MLRGCYCPAVTRALVFDLDGTLVDTLPALAASLNRVLAAAGCPGHPEAAVRGFVGNGVVMLIRRAVPEGVPDGRVAALAREFRADYGARWAEGSWIYPGMHAALAALAGRAPLAVWSNKPHRFTVAMIDGLFPGIPFAAVIGEREGVPRKPDPASATELVAALGHPPAATTLVGDSVTDILSARNAGFGVAAVTWGYGDRRELAAAGPDRWIGHPAELPALLD